MNERITPLPCKRHKKEPVGYCQKMMWLEEMSKTHNQLKCDKCGLFHVWRKK